ncbi:MAG: hypothetical protein K0B37_17640 [Bacteroidales bacterium]|nr:hypothetical protein [Bacteroidales bacterium]
MSKKPGDFSRSRFIQPKGFGMTSGLLSFVLSPVKRLSCRTHAMALCDGVRHLLAKGGTD